LSVKRCVRVKCCVNAFPIPMAHFPGPKIHVSNAVDLLAVRGSGKERALHWFRSQKSNVSWTSRFLSLDQCQNLEFIRLLHACPEGNLSLDSSWRSSDTRRCHRSCAWRPALTSRLEMFRYSTTTQKQYGTHVVRSRSRSLKVGTGSKRHLHRRSARDSDSHLMRCLN